MLDEIQSYSLLHNYLRTEVRGQSFEYSDAVIQEVSVINVTSSQQQRLIVTQIFDFYNDERLCLPSAICSLFRNGINALPIAYTP